MYKEQLNRVHECSIESAWASELFHSNMYPPNSTLKWCDTDIPEVEQYQKDIRYTFNEFGFRSDSFVDRFKNPHSILTSGCSLTVGVGVDQEESWPYILRKMIQDRLGEPVVLWNIATSGASSDYVVRGIYKVLNILRPEFTFVQWPSDIRFEMPSDTNENILTQRYAYEKTFPSLLQTVGWAKQNDSKNKSFLNLQLKAASRIYTSNEERRESFWEQQTIDRAVELQKIFRNVDANGRDGQHPGPDWHRRVAEYYYNYFLDDFPRYLTARKHRYDK